MNPFDENLSLDHIDPNGDDSEQNLVTSCKPCNIAKSNFPLGVFLKRGEINKECAVFFETQRQINSAIEQSGSPMLSILNSVEKETAVASKLIRGKSRERHIVQARMIFVVRARTAGYSLPTIARFLGKHHTSVMHLEKKSRCP